MVVASPIASLLAPERIHLQLAATKRTQAIHDTARLLADHPLVTNFDGFYADLLSRDRLDTTCVGNGIALPHARTDHVKGIVLAVGRKAEGIVFGPGGDTVRLLWVIGTPKARATEYLLLVSAICRLLKDPAVRTRLLECATPEEFVAAVREAEAR